MAVRDLSTAGPPTAFRFSTILGGPKGDKGDPGPTGGAGAFIVGGDLTGASGFQTVLRIQNIPVLGGTPTDGQVLTYVAANSRWEPKTNAFLAAGGDLAGTFPNPTVTGIWAHALPAPTGINTTLIWSGSAFSWATAAGDLPAPGAVIVANTTLTATQQWVKFSGAGPHTLTQALAAPGRLYRILHTGPAGQIDLLANNWTLSNGGAGYTIQDPQNLAAAPAASVPLATSNVTYEFMLDTTDNVLRCLRQVR